MAGLIATTSLRLIERRAERSGSHVFEATLLRLLETYQYDAFRHGKRKSILARSSTRRDELQMGRDLSRDVGDAIAAVHKVMFPKLDRNEFCELIAADVRACFSERPAARELAKRKARLRRFLKLLRDNLPK